MKIALDSSVLIAAHISRAGVCVELLEDLLLYHELVTSEFILQELERNSSRNFMCRGTLPIGCARSFVEPALL